MIPRKTILGSEYFYGEQSIRTLGVGINTSKLPPYSEALGGFSAGWGGAFLAPHRDDLKGWGIDYNEIIQSMRAVLDDVPLFEPDDSISLEFPRIGIGETSTRKYQDSEIALMKLLKKVEERSLDTTFLVGWSRLLTDFSSESNTGCRYCGQCSSGCVFGSIYSGAMEIDKFVAQDQINYSSGIRVKKMLLSHGTVRILAESVESGELRELEADRVFVAAGATQTALIALKSTKIPDETVTIKKTGGFLQPLMTIKRLKMQWPEVNTQSAVFAEFRDSKLSPYWVHAQISPPNELVLQRLGLLDNRAGVRSRLAQLAAEHVATALINLHSDFGPRYHIKLVSSSAEVERTTTVQSFSDEAQKMGERVGKRLSKKLRSVGLFAPSILRQDSISTVGFHFGASFPMSESQSDFCSTDFLGRPFGWENVHFVDTSCLPSIPATTVGVLTMANAFRIASTIYPTPTEP
jgi:choline dehydrogenase-like flavoprotein